MTSEELANFCAGQLQSALQGFRNSEVSSRETSISERTRYIVFEKDGKKFYIKIEVGQLG